MKTNTLKLLLTALLVHLMCVTVVLSHVHASDTVSLMSQKTKMTKLLTGSEITAKALGDLHQHVDKSSLKNINADKGPTTAARVRKLSPLDADDDDRTLAGRLHDFMLRLRVVGSLCYQYA